MKGTTMQVQIDRAEMIPFRELAPGDFFRGASWPNGGQFLYEGDYTSENGESYGHVYVVKTMGKCDGNVNGAESGDVGPCNIEGLRDKMVTRLKVVAIRFAEVGT